MVAWADARELRDHLRARCGVRRRTGDAAASDGTEPVCLVVVGAGAVGPSDFAVKRVRSPLLDPAGWAPCPIRRATCREAHDVHVTTGGARRDAIKNSAARPILTPNHVVQKPGRQVYRTSRSLDCGSKILYFNIFVDFKFERCVECILIYQL